MASYAGITRAKTATLAANTADNITFVKRISKFAITNFSGAAGDVLFVRFDSSAATQNGDNQVAVPPGQRVEVLAWGGSTNRLDIIGNSAAAIRYNVEAIA